jgi:hypothetical protein
MKGQGLSQNIDRDRFLTPKMTSPFGLQSIFSALAIPEYPSFTGNIPFPGDFHAQAREEGFGVKRYAKVVDPIHSLGSILRSCKSRL